MLTALAAKVVALVLVVSPLQAFAPAGLTIKLQVQPAAENRLLRVTVDDGENFFRSTDMDLEGELAPKTQRPIDYPRLPPGDFVVTAQLFNSAGTIIATAQQVVHRIGS